MRANFWACEPPWKQPVEARGRPARPEAAEGGFVSGEYPVEAQGGPSRPELGSSGAEGGVRQRGMFWLIAASGMRFLAIRILWGGLLVRQRGISGRSARTIRPAGSGGGWGPSAGSFRSKRHETPLPEAQDRLRRSMRAARISGRAHDRPEWGRTTSGEPSGGVIRSRRCGPFRCRRRCAP